MSDQEYVRGAWEECEHRDTALAVLAGPHYIVIGNQRRAGWRSFFAHSEAEAWAAAAKFTRERLEQIRQLEEEIEWALEAATFCFFLQTSVRELAFSPASNLHWPT